MYFKKATLFAWLRMNWESKKGSRKGTQANRAGAQAREDSGRGGTEKQAELWFTASGPVGRPATGGGGRGSSSDV